MWEEDDAQANRSLFTVDKLTHLLAGIATVWIIGWGGGTATLQMLMLVFVAISIEAAQAVTVVDWEKARHAPKLIRPFAQLYAWGLGPTKASKNDLWVTLVGGMLGAILGKIF